MKRNVISLLVAAMVLIGLIAFVTPTAEAADPNIYHCLCGNVHSTALTDGEISYRAGGGAGKCMGTCDGTIKEWTPWDGSAVPAGGATVYLTKSVTGSFAFNGKGVNLDLHGNTITFEGGGAPIAKASGSETVNICNSADTAGTIKGSDNRTNNGGVIKALFGTFNLYNVNVEATSTGTMKNGGAITVEGTAKFNMYGGSVKGKSVTANGGAIYVTSTEMATFTDVAISGGISSGGYGGNIFIGGNSHVTLAGTTTVTGGKETANQSGNVGMNGRLTLEDNVKIYGGIYGTNNDRNIRLNSANAVLTVQDNAAVDGGITVTSGAIVVSGNAQIHHNVNTDHQSGRTIYLGSSVIDATGLTSGARIATDAANGVNVAKVAADADASILTCFVAPSGKVAKFVGEGDAKYVQYGDPENLYHCLCGSTTGTHLGNCNGDILTWTAWDGTGVPSGNVYLLADKTTNMVHNGQSGFNLDMNGHDWEYVGALKALAVLSADKVINICNSANESSKICGVDTRETNGGVIALTGNTTLNLYNVNVEADSQTTSGIKTGGAVYISAGTFNMYGGTITGRSVSSTGGVVQLEAGNTCLKGVDISGGGANIGGNIYVAADADLDMYNCTVSGGEAASHAGNVAVVGTAYAEGCTFEDGNAADNGGSIYITGSGSMELKDSTVYGGEAGVGGNINVNTSANISIDGCTIYGGTAGVNAGNIQISNTSDDITISNSVIYGGTAETNNGGNIWLAVCDKTLTLENCYVYGGSAISGGSIVAQRNLVLDNTLVGYTPEGGTQGGVASDRGGNIFVYNGDTQVTVTLQNGSKIAKGSAANGGNVYLNGFGEKLVLKTGTSINIGTASGNGANIYVKNDTVEMEGNARLYGGEASVGGSVYMENGSFTMSGNSVIQDGHSKSADLQDGNVYLKGGTLYMRGDAVIYGGKYRTVTNDGRNIHLDGGTLDMAENAKIDGGIAATRGNVKLADKVQIHAGIATSAANQRIVYLGNGVVIDATGLKTGARIDISGNANAGGVVANITDPAVKACFRGAKEATNDLTACNALAKSDNKVYLVTDTSVAQVNGYDFTAITEAVTAANGTGIVKLMADVADINAAGQILNLDLNGHSVTGTVTAGILNGMDSTTKLYDDTNCGSIAAVSGIVGTFYTHNDGSTIRRYVAIEEGGSYSFHRYYMTVTSVALNPSSTAFTYKVAFLGDETIEQAVAANKVEFGMAFKAETEGTDWLYSEMDAAFVGGPYAEENLEHNTFRYGITNVIKEGENNETRANMDVKAKAYIKVGNETVESTEITRTFNQVLKSADTAYATMDDGALKTNLFNMFKTYYEGIASWTEESFPNLYAAVTA